MLYSRYFLTISFEKILASDSKQSLLPICLQTHVHLYTVIVQGLVSREHNSLKLSVPTTPSSQFAFKSMEPVKIKLLKTVRSFSEDRLAPIAAFFSFVFQTAFGAQVAIKKGEFNF